MRPGTRWAKQCSPAKGSCPLTCLTILSEHLFLGGYLFLASSRFRVSCLPRSADVGLPPRTWPYERTWMRLFRESFLIARELISQRNPPKNLFIYISTIIIWVQSIFKNGLFPQYLYFIISAFPWRLAISLFVCGLTPLIVEFKAGLFYVKTEEEPYRLHLHGRLLSF